MLGILSMLVVVLYNLIEDFSKSSVTVVRSSVDTNARVDVLGSRQNHLLEWNSGLVFLALVLIEDLFSEVLA